ncbi:MAG: DnaA/Hda family protein, partial [Syntrophales bacterium]|nr:DnaA/Hda family protein [Syntrophales bacterium]
MDILWEKCLNIIKENVSQHNFDTWIRPIRITSLQDNCILLSVPNRFFKDWLKENYYSLLKDSLASLVGVAINIDFEISRPGIDFKSVPRRDDRSNNSMMSNNSIPVSGSTVKTRINPSLNLNYTFDRFIVGASNQFAHAASLAVSKQPAKNYNPLFIYGGVGLGKTHLLNAIGLRTMAIHQNIHVLYVSAEEFMNELVNSIRYDKMLKFREKFRQI